MRELKLCKNCGHIDFPWSGCPCEPVSNEEYAERVLDDMYGEERAA